MVSTWNELANTAPYSGVSTETFMVNRVLIDLPGARYHSVISDTMTCDLALLKIDMTTATLTLSGLGLPVF